VLQWGILLHPSTYRFCYLFKTTQCKRHDAISYFPITPATLLFLLSSVCIIKRKFIFNTAEQFLQLASK